MPAHEHANGAVYLALWILIALYISATFLPLFPNAIPAQLIVASHILPTALFAFIHGTRTYRLRGIIVFALLSVVIGNLFESIGVLTGFPFGSYVFTERMGPRLFLVPVLMGPAYFGMGYLSWMLARVILGKNQQTVAGKQLVTVPLAASFVMVAWDLSIDPALSTLGHYWTWQHGGPYFGVPVTNFLGWYLTNYVIYQSFALYQSRMSSPARPLPVAHWRLPVLLYAVTAAGNVLRLISSSGNATVSDAVGVQWRVNAIHGVSALASLFIMGGLALLAGARMADADPDAHPAIAAGKSAASRANPAPLHES